MVTMQRELPCTARVEKTMRTGDSWDRSTHCPVALTQQGLSERGNSADWGHRDSKNVWDTAVRHFCDLGVRSADRQVGLMEKLASKLGSASTLGLAPPLQSEGLSSLLYPLIDWVSGGEGRETGYRERRWMTGGKASAHLQEKSQGETVQQGPFEEF